MIKTTSTFLFALFSLASFASAQNTNLVGHIGQLNVDKTFRTSTPVDRQLSVPLGATASIDSSSADAGALLGFAISDREKESFVSLFFNFSGAKTIEGSQSDFGAFLRDPSRDGNSVYFSGSKKWPSDPNRAGYGVSGRAGVSFTDWKATIGEEEKTVGGFVGYLDPSFMLISKIHSTDNNEYRFGFEVGPSLRILGGELSRNEEFLNEVIGYSDDTILGFQATVFANLNSAQPFIRFSYFSDGTDIDEFSGFQAFIGLNVVAPVFRSELKK